MKYDGGYEPSEARWMRHLMRDPFKLLLKKVRAGEFITPAFFHKCTIPHGFHCFKRYHFRPDPFAKYMRKHHIPLKAPTAAQLHKMTLSALSGLAKKQSTAGHSEPRPQVEREESNLFKSPSEFSFSVAKPARSFRASANRPSREIYLDSTAQPSPILQIENRKPLHALHVLYGFKNPCHSVHSVVENKQDFEKSKPKLDNCKTFWPPVPDT